MARVHETISGHRVEYPDPDAKLERFLERAQKVLRDPRKTDDDMIALVYGRENPLLEATNGMVTREVFDNPVYRVLADFVVRKRIEMDDTNPDRLAAKYTLTVSDVAARKGVSEDAIRKAVRENRLPSWVKGGSYFFEPRSIEAVPLGTRGPMPKGIGPLSYRVGYDKATNTQMRLRTDPGGNEPEEANKSGAINQYQTLHEGTVDRWRRAVVFTATSRASARFFELEPSAEAEKLEFRGFYVRGKFRITRKLNNAKEARKAWESFGSSTPRT
jgi:hypothetical protein